MNWTRYFVTLSTLVAALVVTLLYPSEEADRTSLVEVREPVEPSADIVPVETVDTAPEPGSQAGRNDLASTPATGQSDAVAVQQAAIPEPRSGPVPEPVMLEGPGPLDLSPWRNWLLGELRELDIPGMAMAVVSSRGILDLQTVGVRSVKTGQPVGRDTLFRIASVSKTFAGTVASQLVARDIQKWDAPVMEILPQYSIGTGPSSRGITLRHIMSHSTGLMPHAYSNMLDAGVSYERIREKFPEIPTVCPPGRCYGYQNVVFSLIADVVEQSVQTPYEEYVQQQIFQPLGMKRASMSLEAYSADPDSSAPHRYGRNGWYESTINPAYFSVGPASGINASVMDMVRWAQANLGAYPQVLPERVLNMQHTPVVETPHGSYFNRWPGVDKAWYGVGWRIFDYEGLRVVHHGGGVRGFRTEMALIPELDLGVVVLFNASTRLANEVIPGFMETLLAQRGPASDTLARSD